MHRTIFPFVGHTMTTASISSPPDRQGVQLRSRCVVFFLVAICVPLLYATFTGHVWEDFLITFRHSKNLVEGHGLVYTVGERVHGFTSPIGTLLPAACHAVVRMFYSTENYIPALALFRIFTVIAFAAAGTVMFRAMLLEPGLDRWSPYLFAALYLTEPKSVAFTINGQETAFMLLLVVMGLIAAHRGIEANWKLAAIAWAGLMWTRPDGFVFIGALGLAGLVFAKGDRKPAWLASIRAGLVCVAAYMPWLLWVWWYYGSPIPHTIIAKGVQASRIDYLDPVSIFREILSQYPRTAMSIFEPIYAAYGGWPVRYTNPPVFIMALLATFYWASPGKDRLARIASFAFMLTCAYMAHLNRVFTTFPWYLAPVALLGTVVVARAVLEICGLIWRSARSPYVARTIQAAVVVAGLFHLIGTTIQFRIQQEIIEDGVRSQIGLWFRGNMNPGETILLEPIGYIGYYSNAKLYDWPGLVSPEVVDVRRKGGRDMTAAVKALKPDWLVLRPHERRYIGMDPEVLRSYNNVLVFDASGDIESKGWFPGKDLVLLDARFFIMRRVGATTEMPTPPSATQ